MAESLNTNGVIGGTVFKATSAGSDPDFPSVTGLLPDGLYIRLENADGTHAYVQAFEIDKALGVIAGMTADKADTGTVEALSVELDSKASITAVDLMQSDIDAKASKADVLAIENQLETKADAELVDLLSDEVETKANADEVAALTTAIATKADATDVETLTASVETKANATDVEALQAEVKVLQEALGGLNNESSIAAIQNQINYLNTEIQKRLTIDDLTPVNTAVSSLDTTVTAAVEKVNQLDTAIKKKADTVWVQGQINELNGAITPLASKLPTKADKSELAAKASKSDLDAVVKKVNNLSVTLTDKVTVLEDSYADLNTNVNKKVNKTAFDTAVETLTTAVDVKVDKANFNTAVNQLSSRIAEVESDNDSIETNVSDSIYEIECEMNNALTEMRASISNQTKQITQQNTKISKLEQSSSSAAEQLKQSWVRVLTTNDYKKLKPAPDGVPYNDRYKYPNIVYLVVDFNKPKAIYIGDILVAKAEQSGSIGFAYTFPIVFN